MCIRHLSKIYQTPFLLWTSNIFFDSPCNTNFKSTVFYCAKVIFGTANCIVVNVAHISTFVLYFDGTLPTMQFIQCNSTMVMKDAQVIFSLYDGKNSLVNYNSVTSQSTRVYFHTARQRSALYRSYTSTVRTTRVEERQIDLETCTCTCTRTCACTCTLTNF